MFKKLVNWLSLADYYAAKEDASVEIVSRYARGNVNAQSGRILDREALDKLTAAGDKAMSRVRRAIPA